MPQEDERSILMRNAETLKRVRVDSIASLFNYSPLHAVECLRTLDEIIETLDDRALIEIFNGGEDDVDTMLKGMLNDVYSTIYTGNRDVDFMPKYTERLSESIEEILRCNNLTYFITSVLPDFQLSFHHMEWGDLVHHHNKLCINAARDHGKSFYFSNAYAAWQLYRYSPPKNQAFSRRPTKSNSNRGFLFSFSLQQAVDLIEILKGTIESTDVLRERLMPTNAKDGAWASTNIVCKNGARLTGKGFGSSVRGAHPYWIVVDDGLKDNVIYSQLQRQKSIDYFHSVIMNMLVPGGQIIVVGTPFHAQDLYGDLKSKKGWFVIEYPAIFPDGRILWPQRWSFKDLMDKKNTQGNIIFSRENLCRPIVSDSSIFPLEILKRSLVRMENYTLVRNRDDFPKKFGKVVCGCDFSISSAVGADYYCYSTFGVDEDNGMWLLDLQIGKGRTYDEQLQILKGINVRFRPDVMVFESNVFQQIFTEGATKYGMPVVPHNTGTEKNDLSKGWCAIATAFERSMFHIPIGDKMSQDIKDMIFEQLSSVAFTDKGLQSVGSHDDICSSFWLAMLGRNISTTGFKFSFI
jgi:hypothetical protein